MSADRACRICRQLADREWAGQKHGWPEQDTRLPAVAGELVVVADRSRSPDRLDQLKRCPVCGTHYRYRTDYEFLAGGSEDEQQLTRISDAEAAAFGRTD